MTLSSIWAFLYNNKTKITGLILTAVGTLQANSEAVRQLMTPDQFAVFTIVAGLLVATLGFLNSNKPTI